MKKKELKEKAKKMISGKKWYIWKPMFIFDLILFAILFAIILPVGIATNFEGYGIQMTTNALSSISSIAQSIFMFGYSKYCLDFVRGKESDWKEAFRFCKDHFGPIFLLSLIVSFNIAFGFILLIVPGIMAAIGLTFVQEVYADNLKLSETEVLRKAWALTNGHKKELFVLGLSFIGWFLLCSLTLGILYIWLMPYMTITYTLAYEKLKKK